MTDSERKKKELSALTGIHSTLKRTAKDFGAIVATYEQALATAGADGQPLVNTGQTIYVVRSLETVMLETQRLINEAMAEAGWNQVHVIAKSPSLARREAEARAAEKEEPKKAGNNDINKYSYMQKVTIVGNLAADAKEYQSKGGADMMRFVVVCNDSYGAEKSATNYTVFAKKTGVVEYLKKGRQVMLTGSQKVSLCKDAKGAPAVDIAVYADDITLGRE